MKLLLIILFINKYTVKSIPMITLFINPIKQYNRIVTNYIIKKYVNYEKPMRKIMTNNENLKNHCIILNKKTLQYTHENFDRFYIDNPELENKKLITISPGGFNGFYMMGIVSYIKDNYNLTNYIYSGASAGAWNSIMFSYKGDTTKIVKSIFEDIYSAKLDFDKKNSILELQNVMKNKVLRDFHNTDFELDKLFIGMTTFSNMSIHTHLYNDFHNLDDAFEAIISSSHIPLLTGDTIRKYRDKVYFDGGFSKHPYFALKYPTLEITPNIWKPKIEKKNNFYNWCAIEEYTTLFSKDKYNFVNLFEKGYNDAHLNKDFLDRMLL